MIYVNWSGTQVIRYLKHVAHTRCRKRLLAGRTAPCTPAAVGHLGPRNHVVTLATRIVGAAGSSLATEARIALCRHGYSDYTKVRANSDYGAYWVSLDDEITVLLNRLLDGDRAAGEPLWSAVYEELHRLASAQLEREGPDHTLQPTALVNEVFLRLPLDRQARWASRGQFFTVAARAMRHVLVDHARRRRAAKRGGQRQRLSLDALPPHMPTDIDVLAVDEALTALGEVDAELVQVVELRFFAGLSVDETAAALKIAPVTAKRLWKIARGWLYERMTRED
jgi:RNA polymerase sigma factor (TIGR02999 family)